MKDEEIDEMMDTIDRNGDGKISYTEFRVMLGANPLIHFWGLVSVKLENKEKYIFPYKLNIIRKNSKYVNTKYILHLLHMVSY